MRILFSAVILVLVFPACAPHESPRVSQAQAPEIGKADGIDRADRSCQVVLRRAVRVFEGSEPALMCGAGGCAYWWEATVSVADSVPYDAEVRLMYHLTSDPVWWETRPVAFTESPGYRDYTFVLWEHLFGPETPHAEERAIELVAFLVLPDGTRLFDHNFFRGDFENATLTAGNHYSLWTHGVCQPEVGRITFHGDYTHTLSGVLRQDQFLEVNYDLARLPNCRNTHNGYPAWDIRVHVRFHPGNTYVSGSVRQFATTNTGSRTTQAFARPFWTKIPNEASEVEIWFENFSGAGSSCREWDSNWGQNYRFVIWPDPSHPRCRGVEKESGIRSEDPRMAHNEPYCLPYDVTTNLDATCEFYVDGFGDGYVGHYGFPFHWLVAYMKTSHTAGEVLSAGLYVHYRDNATGAEAHRFLIGIEEAPSVWRAGFAYKVEFPRARWDYTVLDYAFFLDVRRDGQAVRLWHSRHGANYRLEDAFSLSPYIEGIPYGNIRWAKEGSGVLDSKRACLVP